MYVEDWDSFLQMSEALFRQAPLRTRYVLKYRHCDGKLVLKVTDDVAVRVAPLRPAADRPLQRQHVRIRVHLQRHVHVVPGSSIACPESAVCS